MKYQCLRLAFFSEAITVLLLSLITLVFCVEEAEKSRLLSQTGSQYDECTPGFIYNKDLDACECYPSNSVLCSGDEASLRFGRCLTYEEGEGYFLTLCISFLAHSRNVTDRVYITLPKNNTELNEYMCGPMNRKGIACRDCIDGFSPAITSFGYQCSNCTGVWYGVPLFLLLEFVPISIFYIIILVSGISVTTSPMSSFVLFSQLAAHLFTVFITLTAVIENEQGSIAFFLIRLATSLYGVWNLDFFRYVFPAFCISPSLRLFHIFILYYISAFYPLGLIAITWFCIQLHSRNVKPITWLWKRLRRSHCCVCTRRESKNTIIDVFATFFLLSFTKLAYTSLYFVLFVYIDKNGENFMTAAAVDPSFGYFSAIHAPLAIFAFISLFGLILLPVAILTLYPIRAFRSLLQKCKISGHSRAALNLFVEKFYSCYKDGLHGGKDMRSFVFLPFFLRLSIFFGIIFQGEISFWFFHFLLFGSSSLLIAVIQPYKKLYMNIIDAVILSILSLIGIFYILYLFLDSRYNNLDSSFFLFALCFNFSFPLFGIAFIIIMRMIHKKIPRSWIQNISSMCHTTTPTRVEENYDEPQLQATRSQNGVTVTDLELPDRILHPYRYAEDNDED